MRASSGARTDTFRVIKLSAGALLGVTLLGCLGVRVEGDVDGEPVVLDSGVFYVLDVRGAASLRAELYSGLEGEACEPLSARAEAQADALEAYVAALEAGGDPDNETIVAASVALQEALDEADAAVLADEGWEALFSATVGEEDDLDGEGFRLPEEAYFRLAQRQLSTEGGQRSDRTWYEGGDGRLSVERFDGRTAHILGDVELWASAERPPSGPSGEIEIDATLGRCDRLGEAIARQLNALAN
jgi:hypothetical protein